MNYPDVSGYSWVSTPAYVRYDFVIVVNSGSPDNFKGCYWHLYDRRVPTDGSDKLKLIGFGESKGWSGDGAGSALTARKLARAAARRWCRRQDKRRDAELDPVFMLGHDEV